MSFGGAMSLRTALSILATFALTSPAHSAIITIAATADAYFDNQSGSIVDSTILSISDDPTRERLTALEFVLPAQLNGATINSAFIQIDRSGESWGASPTTNTHTHNYYGYSGDGVIALSDFTPVGGIVASTNETFVGTPNNNDINTDVTAAIQANATASDSHAGILIVSPTTTAGSDLYRHFISLESNLGSDPQLVIDFTATAVPEPSSYVLFAIATAVISMRRRRPNLAG